LSEILRSVSPADPKDEVGCFEVSDACAVDAAVTRAREAFPAWRDAGLAKRTELLRAFRDAARAREEELTRLIAREMGKALWDARAEARLVPAKVDLTLEAGLGPVADCEPAPGARATHHPRGVLAVLGPFNFPAHLPNGHIVPALATGNCVVFKPSELTPAVGHWLVDVARGAGIPDGVLELVQGGAETGRALALHDHVNGVLFTGSFAVGQALREATLDQSGKLLALEMGGKNAMLVLRDADLELAVAEAALSICATTGQRCSCLSRIFVEAPILDSFAAKLVSVLERVKIGPPLEDGVFMGPLVSLPAFEKLARYRQLAADAGGERVLEVDPGLAPPYAGAGLVRFADARQAHAYQRDEIFGPEAALYPVPDLEHAIAACNDSDYGLVASVMTRERAKYERCIGRVRTGLLNWNRGTIGASGRLPFGGLGRSGNDRPAGIASSVYCTVPQAHLENPDDFDPSALPPGMPRP
jgi:succinylglutamic semialdehyde dehydrogenase